MRINVKNYDVKQIKVKIGKLRLQNRLDIIILLMTFYGPLMQFR